MITAAPLTSSLIAHRVPILLAVLMLGLSATGDSGRAALAFNRHAMEAGQLWRVLSGHWVHLGTYHCGLNLLGLAALAILSPAPLSSLEWMRRLLVLSLGVSAGLYVAVPDLERYVGLSGVLHGLILLALVPMAQRGELIALGCLLYLFGKLAWEYFAGVPVTDEQAIGGRVVTEAHLFGTLSGVLYGLAFGIFRKGESAQ